MTGVDVLVAVAFVPVAPLVVGVVVRVLVEVLDEVPVEAAVVVVVEDPPQEAAATAVKLAHVMRVVLAKWKTKERFPKKAPIPLRVEA